MASHFTSQKPLQTKRIAKILGKELKSSKLYLPRALCILLSGELGAGKTLFTQGLLEGLGYHGHVHSPTFVLMKRYPIKGAQFKNVWHVDCYRIDDVGELDILGFENILSDPNAIVVIEWPERLTGYTFKNAISISLHHKTPEARIITITA